MDLISKILNEIKLDIYPKSEIHSDHYPAANKKFFYTKYKGLDFYLLNNEKLTKTGGWFEAFKDKKFIGDFQLEFFQDYYPYMADIHVNKKYRGTGMADLLYEFVLDKFGMIASGSSQTVGSQTMWLKLAKKYTVLFLYNSKFYKTYIENNEIKTNTSIPIYNNKWAKNRLICFKKYLQIWKL